MFERNSPEKKKNVFEKILKEKRKDNNDCEYVIGSDNNEDDDIDNNDV